jgi:KaiC/GvpD/RAD55 family RecA-like ATPase
MSFEEPEDRIIAHMESFGWPASEYAKKGLLRVERFDALDVSRSIEALLSAAKKELLIDINSCIFPSRLFSRFCVIDSLTSISSAFSGEESRFRILYGTAF